MSGTDRTAIDDAAIATEMSYELDRLQASIARRLGLAGIEIPDAALTAVVDGILNDAVRVALLWLGERGGALALVNASDPRRSG